MKALHATFGIHKAARGFRERSDGQQHVADVQIGLEWAERHHHFGLVQPLQCLLTRSAIQRWFIVQQDGGLQSPAIICAACKPLA